MDTITRIEWDEGFEPLRVPGERPYYGASGVEFIEQVHEGKPVLWLCALVSSWTLNQPGIPDYSWGSMIYPLLRRFPFR